MNVEEKINELEAKIDINMDKIIKNMNRLHKHEEKINNNTEKIKNNSYALEILKDYKLENKRLYSIIKRMGYIIALLIIVLSFVVGYLIYILNDIGTTEETITQENESGYNSYIGNDGDITNG